VGAVLAVKVYAEGEVVLAVGVACNVGIAVGADEVLGVEPRFCVGVGWGLPNVVGGVLDTDVGEFIISGVA
jgi:hypothetical protein